MLLLPAGAYANVVTPQFTTGSMNSTTTTTQTITEVEQRQVFGAEVKTWNGSNVTPSADIAASGTTFTITCLLYTSPSPRDVEESRMPSSA